MKPQVSIPKELLAQVDFLNTIHGGMTQPAIRAWQGKEGFHLVLGVPGVDLAKVRIEAVQQRFVVYYLVDVLDGSGQEPYYLINLPLLPIVDVDRIQARVEDGQIHIFAPFNDWAKGSRKEIALGE